jgi:Tfp pilus assembly protein PilF
MKGKYYRRPIWRPSRLSRLLGFLRKQLTFKRVVLALFVLPVLFYVYREVSREVLIIDPFSVPKRFEETGLTPEVVANRIGDAMRAIETSAETQMKKDNLTSLRDQGSTPDVEIPGTKLGLKTLVEVTRTVFGIYPKHASGDIVALMSADSSVAKSQLKVTVYITQGRNRSQAISLVVNSNDIDVLAQDAAEMILEQVNPYVLAVYQYHHSETGRAVELLERIVQDPSQDRRYVAAAFNSLGNVLNEQKKYDEAIVKYQKAIKLNPKNAPAYNNWGNVLDEQKKYDEAIAKYQKAIELDPKYALAYNGWGNVLSDKKKYDEAIAKYQKAIELDPKYALAYDNWGNVLYDQKKYDEAIAKYQKAIELDPKYADAYNGWGNVLYDQKK